MSTAHPTDDAEPVDVESPKDPAFVSSSETLKFTLDKPSCAIDAHSINTWHLPTGNPGIFVLGNVVVFCASG